MNTLANGQYAIDGINPFLPVLLADPTGRAQASTPWPPRMAEKRAQAPRKCPGGPIPTIFGAIQRGLGPPEPLLQGHQLSDPSHQLI